MSDPTDIEQELLYMDLYTTRESLLTMIKVIDMTLAKYCEDKKHE